MSHPYASQTPSTGPLSSRRMSRRAPYKAKQNIRTTRNRSDATRHSAAHPRVANTRLSKQLASTPGQTDSRGSGRHSGPRSGQPLLRFFTPHRRKLLGAGGAITVLAMATILPTQVSSQAIADSNCEQVVKSGAEVSRGQLSSLLEMPTRSTREAVRQVVAEPYCTLPALTPVESTYVESAESGAETKTNTVKTIDREAYPLAFDPEAWLIVKYSEGEYQGYDFVFKP